MPVDRFYYDSALCGHSAIAEFLENCAMLCSSWTSTIWPSYNGQTSFEVSFSPNSLRTKVEAGIDNVRKVTVFVTSAYDITGREKKINGLVKFTLPYMVCFTG